MGSTGAYQTMRRMTVYYQLPLINSNYLISDNQNLLNNNRYSLNSGRVKWDKFPAKNIENDPDDLNASKDSNSKTFIQKIIKVNFFIFLIYKEVK